MNIKEINGALNVVYTRHDWFHRLLENITEDGIDQAIAIIEEDSLLNEALQDS